MVYIDDDIYILGCPYTKILYARVEAAYFGLSNEGLKLKIGGKTPEL